MTRIFFSKEIDKEIVLWHAFLIYYTHLYKNWTEEQLGFDPKTLKEWLYNQFHCNNGNMFLVDGENSDSLGFLSFKLSESFVDICQVVGNKNQRDGFFKLLVELYPNARFYGVIRKQNKELLDYYLSIGCRIVENHNPNYDSKYYCGIEMYANQLTNKNE